MQSLQLLTASGLWCDYPCKLPMVLFTHFLSPGPDREGTGWYFNAKLCGASTVTPGWNSRVSRQNAERVNGIKQKRCTVQHVVCKSHSQEWPEKWFLEEPELCLPALKFLWPFGQVHLWNQLSKREGMRKKKIIELHIAFRDCSQRKSEEKQSEI